MGLRTATIAVASKSPSAGSAWCLFTFISDIFYILLSIILTINFNRFIPDLVPLIRRRNPNTPESSTNPTPTTNPPIRHTVVQGHEPSAAVQVEIENDNDAPPPIPVLPAMVPHRGTMPPLMGSLIGILADE